MYLTRGSIRSGYSLIIQNLSSLISCSFLSMASHWILHSLSVTADLSVFHFLVFASNILELCSSTELQPKMCISVPHVLLMSWLVISMECLYLYLVFKCFDTFLTTPAFWWMFTQYIQYVRVYPPRVGVRAAGSRCPPLRDPGEALALWGYRVWPPGRWALDTVHLAAWEVQGTAVPWGLGRDTAALPGGSGQGALA